MKTCSQRAPGTHINTIQNPNSCTGMLKKESRTWMRAGWHKEHITQLGISQTYFFLLPKGCLQ